MVTRGGAAISIKTVVNKPIKFVGTGEKMEALDVFYPIQEGNFGMGDVVFSREHKNSLMKKKLEEFKIIKNEFGFDDFLTIQQVKRVI
jgi:signal recognition particle subunit SRP54